jgi:4-hydroxy-2-oxoheptanedioate aldolase
MRRSKVLAKIREGRFTHMASLGHVIPSFLKQAAHFGYDGIWLDLEHRCMDEREVQMMLAYAHSADIDIMVRPPTLEKTRLYRYMEDGASGVMIPHCSTPEKAKMIVESVKYPPVGDRGLDGAGFDTDFMLDGGDDYIEAANRETFVVCQIETVEAVHNADAIAAVDGVDVLFIGPADLTLRLPLYGDGMTLDDAIAKVSAACRKHGKHWAITAGTTEQLAERKALGAAFIPWGGDFGFVYNGLKDRSAELDEIDSQ